MVAKYLKVPKDTNLPELSCECVNSDIILNTYAKGSIVVYTTALDCNPLSGVDDIHANCNSAKSLSSVWNISMAQGSFDLLNNCLFEGE